MQLIKGVNYRKKCSEADKEATGQNPPGNF